MFIDITATKLYDSSLIRNLHRDIMDGELNHIHAHNHKVNILNRLTEIFREVNNKPKGRLVKLINNFDDHITLSVVTDYDVSINGSYRDEYSTHSQLHVSREMVSLALSYEVLNPTMGLIVANNQSRNPLYYDPNRIIGKIVRGSVYKPSLAEVHKLIPKVRKIMNQPVGCMKYNHIDVLVEFLKQVGGFLDKDKVILQTDRLRTLPVKKPTEEDLKNYHYVALKIFLLIAMTKGNGTFYI